MNELGRQRTIRVARSSDAAAIQAIYAPIVRETPISFEEVPPSVQDMKERIAETLAFHPYLVCEQDAELIGYAYAGAHRARAAYRWSVDVSVYVAATARRSGVGRALYAALLHLLRHQGFHSAFAGITLPNPNSVGLHEALGFRPVGTYKEVGFKHGTWHDVGWWRLALGEGLPAGDPIAFSDLGPEADDLIHAIQSRCGPSHG
jgi:phosphinothricin acetyltransferase